MKTSKIKRIVVIAVIVVNLLLIFGVKWYRSFRTVVMPSSEVTDKFNYGGASNRGARFENCKMDRGDG
jgi:hypothetical protein